VVADDNPFKLSILNQPKLHLARVSQWEFLTQLSKM
jgi:hypothetical protein